MLLRKYRVILAVSQSLHTYYHLFWGPNAHKHLTTADLKLQMLYRKKTKKFNATENTSKKWNKNDEHKIDQ